MELVVACTLLASVMTLFVPTVIRSGHARRDLRHHRLALDELSNQMEQLTQLSAEELSSGVEQLQLSEIASGALPDARLSASLVESEDGLRLTLQLAWGNTGRRTNPLTLNTWIYPSTDDDRPSAEKEQ